MKYVIALSVAFVLNQFHAAVCPVVELVGTDATVCKYRARAPVTNGVAIDVPT